MPSGLTLEVAVFATAAAIDGRDVDAACDPAVVVECAIVHRVSALLAQSGWSRSLPPAEAAKLEEDARLGALHGAVLDRELEHLLATLRDRGLTPLVIKGAHLAHAPRACGDPSRLPPPGARRPPPGAAGAVLTLARLR